MRLRELRNLLGLSLTDLKAQLAVDVAPNTIARIERGDLWPSPPIIDEIRRWSLREAIAFGKKSYVVTADDLLDTWLEAHAGKTLPDARAGNGKNLSPRTGPQKRVLGKQETRR